MAAVAAFVTAASTVVAASGGTGYRPPSGARYLMVESVASMPRTALAALVVEGFVPALRHDGAGTRLTQRLGGAVLSR